MYKYKDSFMRPFVFLSAGREDLGNLGSKVSLAGIRREMVKAEIV